MSKFTICVSMSKAKLPRAIEGVVGDQETDQPVEDGSSSGYEDESTKTFDFVDEIRKLIDIKFLEEVKRHEIDDGVELEETTYNGLRGTSILHLTGPDTEGNPSDDETDGYLSPWVDVGDWVSHLVVEDGESYESKDLVEAQIIGCEVDWLIRPNQEVEDAELRVRGDDCSDEQEAVLRKEHHESVVLGVPLEPPSGVQEW